MFSATTRTVRLLLLAAAALVSVQAWAYLDDEPDTLQADIAGLRRFQFLIGDWRATSQIAAGQKTGTVENLTWHWYLLPNEPPALKMEVQDGDYFTGGLLRYDSEDDSYLFVGQRVVEKEDGKKPKTETVVYEGKATPSEIDPNVSVLALSRKITGTKQEEQVTLRLREKHHYVFQLDKRRTKNLPFRPIKVFSTSREGTSIAKLEEAAQGPECFISGGLGTMTYNYKGKTYYFCCSGCLDSFKDDPEKWIAEVNKKKDAKKTN